MRRQLYTMLLLAVVAASGSTGCSKKDIAPETNLAMAPAGFPRIPFPADNIYTQEKWLLGKKLFYERAFSDDGSVSCASCHLASRAFSDTVAISPGTENRLGKRNAPSLGNVAYHPYYTRDGGVPTLEMQILVPIQEHEEFSSNILDIAERLKAVPEYVQLSQQAFGRDPDPYVITRAIATFERTMVTGNSLYDQYLETSNTLLLSQEALRGMELFFSERTSCSSCHSGFNFTNYSFENNGLYTNYADMGRARVTGKAEDLAVFKVPSLRNIALTAPYMHDGSVATLAGVVAHYNTGGHPHPNKSEKIRPLGLSEQERNDIVAFLEALTDNDFVTDKRFSE